MGRIEKRFIIKTGRFGQCLHDTRMEADLSLEQVLFILNKQKAQTDRINTLDISASNKERIDYLNKNFIYARDKLDEIAIRMEHHADMIYNKLVRKDGDNEICSFGKSCDCFVEKDKQAEVISPK